MKAEDRFEQLVVPFLRLIPPWVAVALAVSLFAAGLAVAPSTHSDAGREEFTFGEAMRALGGTSASVANILRGLGEKGLVDRLTGRYCAALRSHGGLSVLGRPGLHHSQWCRRGCARGADSCAGCGEDARGCPTCT